MQPERKSRPVVSGTARVSEATKTLTSVPRADDLLSDLDALAESLRGYLVVQVVIDDDGHRRTTLYRNAGAAERAVRRAQDRGRKAHVTLAQLLPVGVVLGMAKS